MRSVRIGRLGVFLATCLVAGGGIAVAPARSHTEAVPASGVLAATAVTIVAAGDIACDPSNPQFHAGNGSGAWCRAKATEALIRSLKPTAILPLGDEQYVNGALAKFRHSYALSWGRERSITRPVPGNHEYETPGGAGYYSYFGSRAGPGRRGWYAYTLGGWRMVALNSNCSTVGCGPGTAQYRWLKRYLASHPASCTLAYFHHPRFSSGPHGDDLTTAPLWQLLYAGGADVILNGHDHLYERFKPLTPAGIVSRSRGIREFIVGTGGAQHYAVVKVHIGSAVRNADTFGVLQLTLGAGTYHWSFVPIAGGSYADSGNGVCH
jgi:3',5'-cyclic AMP phosphodiesterase CpdA